MGRTKQFEISDLFLVLLVVSLLFAAARLMFDQVGPIQLSGFHWQSVATKICVWTLVIGLATYGSKRVFAAGGMLSIVGFVFLVSEPVERLRLGHVADTYHHSSANTRIEVTAALFLFIFLAAYRLRGVRLVRQRSVLSD